tara:strand:- start:28142 stop:28711 length:570 start_codon:yes stop_codon:yes gene_type:complete
MKTLLLFYLFSVLSLSAFAQYNYTISEENPFGKLNPNAPKEVADYDLLIGESQCTSISRAPDQTWNPEIKMLWRFKYIMNGMAVQDETLKEDGTHSGSIRQFNSDSSAWYVHYFSSGSAPSQLPVWNGSTIKDGEIILYREQSSPNGLEGFYKIRFFDVKKNSFKWIGAWVNKDESIQFPTWKISCQKN